MLKAGPRHGAVLPESPEWVGGCHDAFTGLIDSRSAESHAISAIPHGKTDKVKRLVAVLGISKQGVNFDALDGEPVYIFFLLVAPKDCAGPHLKALALISRLLRDTYFCQLIRKANSADALFDLIRNEEEKKH